MTADRYRKSLFRIFIALVVVAVIVPGGLLLIGMVCGTQSCAFGVAFLFILNLIAIGLTLLILAIIFLVVSMRRCKDLGTSGFLAVPSALLLLDVVGQAILTWRWWGTWWVASPVVSLLLSILAAAVFSLMLGTMRSEALRDAERTKPLVFWILWLSAAIIVLGAIPSVLSYVRISLPSSINLGVGEEIINEVIRGFAALRGYIWLTAAKIVFIACVLALMRTPQGPNSGDVASTVTASSG